MGKLRFHRVYTCQAARPSDGALCEVTVPKEGGTHEGEHQTTVWALDELGESYPNHPEYWL